MVDHSHMRLGKLAAKPGCKHLLLAKYTTALPAAPAAIDYGAKLTDLGVMLNDQLGDCTCAAVGHVIQAWSANAGQQAIVSDADVLALYEKACGYNPADPSTDQGGVETDVLDYWRRNGVAGHALTAYAAAQPANHADIMDAVWLFGAAYIGVELPLSAQTQDVWDVPLGGAVGQGAPGSWGGHAVPIVAYDSRGLTCLTWGAPKRMTWAFWDAYVSEAYGLIGPDWIAKDGLSPSGFATSALLADLPAL